MWEDKYIAQKYIETPLIVKRRKFDIRQWVLAGAYTRELFSST